MDLLLGIFISPIVWLMHNLLNIINNIIGNYGVSIIILSIFINIIILPLSYLAEDFKNIHQKKISKFKYESDLIKKNYFGQERHFYLKSLYRINRYHPFSGIKASLGLLIQIPFFFAAFHFLGNYDPFIKISFGPILDLSQPDGLFFGLNLLPLLMTLIAFLSAHFHTKNKSQNEKYSIWFLSIFFLVFLYLESSALLIYWTINNFFTLIKIWIENNHDITYFKKKCVYLLSHPIKFIIQNKFIKFLTADIYFQSVFLFFGTIFIYQAIPIAASDISMYNSDYTEVIINLLVFFVFSLISFLIIYNFLIVKVKKFAEIIISFISLLGLFFSFIIPFQLDYLVSMSFPDFLIFEHKLIKLIKLLIIFTLLIFYFFIFSKFTKIILSVILISNVILTSQAIVKGLDPKYNNMISKDLLFEADYDDGNKDLTESEANKLYSFSKESNTIVILLDAFQGNMFADIIEDNPEIKKELNGFTYYPNTLAAGGGTWLSIGSILGGQNYQIHLAQKSTNYETRSDTYIGKENTHVVDAYLQNAKIAKKYNHSYAISGSIYGSCSIYDDQQDITCSNKVITSEKYLNKINDIQSSIKSSSTNTAIFFSQLSWILSLPHVLKSKVSFYFQESGKYEEFLKDIYYYSQLQNIVEFANSNSIKKTSKFIYNSFTHRDWLVNDKCEITYDFYYGYQGAYNADYCSLKLLISLFKKLKKMKIYDKTKIIIVSDHGHHLLKENVKSSNFQIPISQASALLLVKDFKEKDDFKVSWKFMSNMDTYGIMLSGVSEGKQIELDRIKTPEKNRSLIHIHKTSPVFSLNITEAYKVKKNIFNDENWIELNFDQIQDLKKISN